MSQNSNSNKLDELVDQQTKTWVMTIVEAAAQREHDGLVAMLVQKLRGISASPTVVDSAGVTSEWVGIESLSRLRSVVGGRFQNIKKKWVDAGFPLREHRGDRWKEFEMDRDAWLELAAWIAKQGYEARLTPESEEFIFQLKAQSK